MSAYTHTTHDGKVVNKRTKAMLLEAEKRLGYELTIVQGSYNRGVSQSAGTHDGGGAIDLAPWDWQTKVMVLRRVGFAAWYRPAIAGHWNAHIHAIAIADRELSDGAANQVKAYYNGRDGLAGNGPDPHERPNPIPVFKYWKTFSVHYLNVRHQFMTDKPKKTIGVKMIQRALNKKLGLNLSLDGIAGPATRRAYQKWEKKLGYKNPNAIPNKHSIRKLGRKRFTLEK